MQTSEQNIPTLSVIVVTMLGKESLEGCLHKLVVQEGDLALEFIIPFDDARKEVADLQTDFPGVRFLPLEGWYTYAQLRAIGVGASHGELIAITEDHCKPEKDWCLQIVQAHTLPHAAIGGAVEKLSPDSILNWALYFADYLRYMNPLTEGPTGSLTDLNVSYKTHVLEQIRHAWEEEFHEPTVHVELERIGEQLYLAPSIVVKQKRSLTLRAAIADRFDFGRLFASTRLESASLLTRLKFLALSPLVPALLMARMSAQILLKGRNRLEFILAIPALVLLCVVWATGELIGYLTGNPGKSLSAKSNQDTQRISREQNAVP